MQLLERHTYRAKNPTRTKCGFVNDRTITQINTFLNTVCYDGPAQRLSQIRRRFSRFQFEAWASHDVTDQLPGGQYMTWEQYLASSEKAFDYRDKKLLKEGK